jgi:hypothetical protein
VGVGSGTNHQNSSESLEKKSDICKFELRSYIDVSR